jgi:hypothetical protein
MEYGKTLAKARTLGATKMPARPTRAGQMRGAKDEVEV